jgi:hypothetical protein
LFPKIFLQEELVQAYSSEPASPQEFAKQQQQQQFTTITSPKHAYLHQYCDPEDKA